MPAECMQMNKSVDAEDIVVFSADTFAVNSPPISCQKPAPRYELQGLRAVAIIAVLLFHCWQRTFTVGYLGVDVFFIISGYLMCRLLSRRYPLTAESVLDFYFRRIKRIVPIYLFVIVVTLMVAARLIFSIDYKRIVEEAVPSVFFYSNFPSVHRVEYFDLRSRYYFFLHTWSLSTEMQFYLIVPLLFLIAQKLSKPSLFFIFGALLFVLSFLRQCFAEGVAKHMPLDGRIWQFMSGFAAHFLVEWGTLKVSDKRMLKLVEDYPWMGKCGKKLLDYSLNILLTVLLLVSFSEDQQLERFVVIFVGTVFVALPNNSESFLSTDFLVKLGDVSYSIYLIHWPVFTVHRLLNEKLYHHEKDPPHIEGSYLILVSVVSGYFVERIFSQILKRITSWKSLISLILFLYITTGGVLIWMHSQSILGTEISERNSALVEEHTLMLWNSRNSPKGQSKSREEYIQLNSEMVDYGYTNQACRNATSSIPTRFPYSLQSDEFSRHCTEKSTGQKNVVILGNSHAFMGYLGIRHHFLDIAANITLFSFFGCTPVPEEHQYGSRGIDGQRRCFKFITEAMESLRQWDHPIDLIVTLWGYNRHTEDPPLVIDWTTDPMFTFMQKYYDELNEIAREAVLVSGMNLYFDKKPFRILEERLLNNQTIGEMGEPLKVIIFCCLRIFQKQQKHFPGISQRINRIHCPKCVPINWFDLWCRAKHRSFCRTVEKQRPIALFLDRDHTTPYGSMFVGEVLRRKYSKFVERK